MEEFLGIDVGSKRIGVARGSTAAKIAEPLVTLEANEAVPKLKSLAKDRQVAGIVVGLPRNMKGEETAQTTEVRLWVDRAKESIDLPFFWQDESLTSQKALEAGAGKADIDALAAAIILQDFLDGAGDGRQSV